MTMDMLTSLMEIDPAMVEAAAGGLIALYFAAIAAMVYIVIRYMVKSIGYCTMYRKAGVAGWKAFIPFYNTYNNYKLSWG